MNNNNPLHLSDFSYWQSKKLYTQLMEKFINGIIDGKKFEDELYKIWNLLTSNVMIFFVYIFTLIIEGHVT